MNNDCIKKVTDSRVKVEENGKKAVIINKERETYLVAKVDGCLITNRVASDWVVSRTNIGDVVVELKGCDVDRAAVQVKETIRYWASSTMFNGAIGALIVCARYPRVDTKIQRVKAEVARSFKAPVHVVTKNSEYEFKCLLSFKGPYKS